MEYCRAVTMLSKILVTFEMTATDIYHHSLVGWSLHLEPAPLAFFHPRTSLPNIQHIIALVVNEYQVLSILSK
jgi:hypothetical protein